MKFRNFKIGTRLAVGFSIIMILILFILIFALDNIRTLSDQTTRLYKHPFAVSNAVRKIEAESVAIREKLYLMMVYPTRIDSLLKEVDSLDRQIIGGFDLLKERFLGSKDDVEHVRVAFEAVRKSRNEIVANLTSGQTENAKFHIQNRTDVVARFDRELDDVIKFATKRGELFYEEAVEIDKKTVSNTLIAFFAIILMSGLTGLWITRSVRNPLITITGGVEKIESGDYYSKIKVDSKDEIGTLAGAINKMASSLGNLNRTLSERDWIKTGINELNFVMRGELDVKELANNVVEFYIQYFKANVGTFYVMNFQGTGLNLTGGYAIGNDGLTKRFYSLKEGLVGECASSGKSIVLEELPENYFYISSSTGSTLPANIVVTPIFEDNKVIGVIELGTFIPFSSSQLELLKVTSESIGIAIESARSRSALKELLKQTQEMAEELQVQQEELSSSNENLEAQQEELRAVNEELAEQSEKLQKSETQLKAQQEELQVTNEELEEKNDSLQKQKATIQKAREELEIQTEELAIASKYKSEFLANMSHELRTPLNSLLILSKMLADNKYGNLNADQVESADVIYRSGTDLLLLINEILDLSKIEAGKMDIHPRSFNLSQLHEKLKSDFKHSAELKGIELEFVIKDNTPESIESDQQRVEQILKNLISNAIKFTRAGKVSIETGTPSDGVDLVRSGLSNTESIFISVTDTGIGIPTEKQKLIFQAFQQADGSTAREFGGTGLGLSISKELAHLLGGEIQVQSEPGIGSTFTLFLPFVWDADHGKTPLLETLDHLIESPIFPLTATKPTQQPKPQSINDDRSLIKSEDKTILIIEDDSTFAKLLYNECKEKNFKGLIALNGGDGLELARKYLPTAILLDLGLPDINGIEVLDFLKSDSNTRHIPVHIVSVESSSIIAYKHGAVGFLTKPANQEEIEEALTRLENFSTEKIKNLLIIEDDTNLRLSISKLIGGPDVNIRTVATGMEALNEVRKTSFDCIILDIGLPDMSGFQLLKSISEIGATTPPVIIYTGRELSKQEDVELRNYADSIIIKGVRSEERLLDEASLFLHRLVTKMPENKRRMIIDLHETDDLFVNKKILIVDDDMRNVFALSKILSEKGMKLFKAEDGKKALEIITAQPDMDLVIMDIMMPVMDGYETMRQIRKLEQFDKLPIIAVTAKAMKKDYEACIAAGASDYLPKPVDTNRLLSVMRVWLYR
ncbi:MAG: response regulator [Ignavibacteriales bacterium]|nr:response regulator [Ignavibacteriales bacterium]